MKTYNVGFSGDSSPVFHALLEFAESLQILEGVKVAHITTNASEEQLLAIQGVSFVEEDLLIPLVAEWHLQRVSTQFLPLPSSPKRTNEGVGSTVYLIDSKVEITPELSDANITVLYDHPSAIIDGHGTAMASLIVGRTVGVAPKAKLMTIGIPLNGLITVSDILSAFDAILNDTNRPAVSVVNCSWSIPKSQLLDNKIMELQSAGVVVVAAAGNSGVAADLVSPAGLNSVIGVGASDAFDRVIPWDTGSSNWGPEVDLFAPGIDITIPIGIGNVVSSGTSLSAAIVSGVVAQAISKYPQRSAAAIQSSVIENTVEDTLFWDFSVYGSTPNRLIQNFRLMQDDLWRLPSSPSGRFSVRSGEGLTLDLSFSDPIVSAEYGIVNEIRPPIYPYSWVTTETLSSGNIRVVIAPSEEVEPGKYIAIIRGLNSNNELISAVWLRIWVYQTEENEIDPLAEERYLVYNTDTDSVNLTAHFTCCGTGCAKGSICCTFTGQVDDYSCVEDTSGAVACC